MTALLPCPVPAQDWRDRSGGRNGLVPTSGTGQCTGIPEGTGTPDRWETIIQEMVRFQDLGENWDGLGAPAPSRELIESAIGLARVLKEGGADAPTLALAGTDGSVNLLWHGPDGTYCEIEIDRPLHADVVLLEPGKEPRHWELPNA